MRSGTNNVSTANNVLRLHFRLTSACSSGNFLTCPYDIDCNGQTTNLGWSRKTSDLQMAKQLLDAFSAGNLNAQGALWLGQTLRRYLAGRHAALDNVIADILAKGVSHVELTCDVRSVPLLTNIPWEITCLDANPRRRLRIADVLAKFPLARVVSGKKWAQIPDGRLRAYYCISNPQLPDMVFNANRFRRELDLTFHQFPVIDVRPSQMSMSEPQAARMIQELREFEPHIVIFVGHGDSSGKVSSQPQLLFEKWTDLSRVTQCLLESRAAALVLFICCDMTRQSESLGSWSAAQALAMKGIPSIVAMQGNIQPQFAAVFLEDLLVSLLSGEPVSNAVAQGRKPPAARGRHSRRFSPRCS